MKNRQDNRLEGGSREAVIRAWRGFAAAALLAAGLLDPAGAATANITATKHNLSKTGTGTVKSSTETQICAFCHTPHGANVSAPVPLWNKTGSGNSYTTYKSASLQADNLDAQGYLPQPAGSSLMCLSCHDGTVALGSVNVLRGAAANLTIDNSAAAAINDPQVGAITKIGGMPAGSNGATTGFTRLIGTNLSNDHPISVNYNNTLATNDGELRGLDSGQRYPAGAPAAGSQSVIGLRSSGVHPLLPLLPTGPGGTGQVQCATCHDPHITNEKFLRLNRLQGPNAPSGTGFDPTNDIICLACHDKGGTEWSNSVHARSDIATYTYQDTAATLREFPTGTPVWKAACLNCHDTHTVAGARRLLREGVEAGATTGYTARAGNKSAIEETCYQCHNKPTPASGPSNVLNSLPTMTPTTGVPDIKSEFNITNGIRMPITRAEQGNIADEAHEINDADFTETPAKLGTTAANRHVECTDCHNPHRVIRNARYDGTGANQRTHVAGGTAGSFTVAADGNVASGVLRGMWGIEPTYSGLSAANSWPKAGTYTVKKGKGSDANAMTREYQLCFKCHSDYSNTSFATLGRTAGTPSGTNGMTVYTNVAAEFAVNAANPPVTGTDQGEYGESSVAAIDDGVTIEPSGSYPADAVPAAFSGSNVAMTAPGTTTPVNHRSWHPVTNPTGRSKDERRISAASGFNFRAPFDAKIGTQTMYCSDCHGNNGNVEASTTASNNSWTRDSGPNLNRVQGPHGSSANFILKGSWSTSVTIGGNGLCYNCHNPSAGSYTTPGDSATGTLSGFNAQNQDSGGGHGNAHSGKPCMRCHVAVPHGWRNKAFLVNLNCVGTEADATSGGCKTVTNYAGIGQTTRYDSAPYYNQSYLRVVTWRASGNWTQTSCGVGSGGLKAPGKDWMTDGNSC